MLAKTLIIFLKEVKNSILSELYDLNETVIGKNFKKP